MCLTCGSSAADRSLLTKACCVNAIRASKVSLRYDQAGRVISAAHMPHTGNSEMPPIYLAGGLFNAGERLHNLYLEKHLTKLGYRVLLPQRRALNFVKNGLFDLKAVVRDCQACCTNLGNWYCGSLDGADADSGTAVEYGMAVASTGRAIVYRTDFRTDTAHEIGVNGMFHAGSTFFVYEPCFFTDLSEVDGFYEKLAKHIDATLKERC